MTQASDIEQQAAEWLMRRDAAGEGTSKEFAVWLTCDPRHRAAYLRLAAAWERSARLKMLAPEDGSIDPDLLARKRRHWGSGRSLALAAGISALAIATATWIGVTSGAQTYRTEVGGLSRVVLRDGSTVMLNTDTIIRVQMSKGRREVRLLRGEAQFAVVHDIARPFEVLAGDRLVRAVGTAFDVRLDHGDVVEVTVTEGRVVFVDTAAGGTDPLATIAAGESALSGPPGKVTVRQVDAAETSRHLAWQAGALSFQGETLTEAVTEFNRYNRRKLKVDDPSIADLRIGGNFQALDVDSFVAALERSFGVVANATDDGALELRHAPPAKND
jgi:transmembrane sensor